MLFAAFFLAVAVSSCIEDGFTGSPADQPVFSVDTLHLGVIFTGEPSPTSRFVVHNPHPKQLSISRIAFAGENAGMFRMNVDGISGRDFSGVEIRAKDSIFVFVETTLPEGNSAKPIDFDARIEFTTNGVTSAVVVDAQGQDVERLRDVTIGADTHFTAGKPYQIFGTLEVAEGVTLTLDAGTQLCFHDGAMLVVRGTLRSEGTVDRPVNMCGDRTGNVVADISFDIMSRQWTGVFFTTTSRGNVLKYTDIRNTFQGVSAVGWLPDEEAGGEEPSAVPQVADGSGTEPVLTMLNCRLHNSGDLVLEAVHAGVRAIGCEFGEGGGGLVRLQGGTHLFNHCTFANYYLFSVLGGPAIAFAHLSADEKTGADDGSGLPYISAEFANSIVYGNGTDISHGDLTGTDVFFRRCLLKSEGTDDDNFIACLWGEDPLYYTVREEYIFDSRLKPGSPAIGAGDPALMLPEAATDAYGLPRGAAPDLGAYVFNPALDAESAEQ